MAIKHNSEYLSNEAPILLYPALARAFGTEKAAIIQQVRFWTSHYERVESLLPTEKRMHFHDGRWWVYNTYQNWESSNFDWIPADTLRRLFNQLETVKVFISGEFNRAAGDRTKWYTIDYDKLDSIIAENELNWREKKRQRKEARQQAYAKRTPSDQNDQLSTNPSDQNDHTGDQNDRLIPEITTEITKQLSGAALPVPRKPKKEKLDANGVPLNNKHPQWLPFWNAVLTINGITAEQLTGTMKGNIARIVAEIIQPLVYEPEDVLYFSTFAEEKDWRDWTVNAIPARIADVRRARLASLPKPRPIRPAPTDDGALLPYERKPLSPEEQARREELWRAGRAELDRRAAERAQKESHS